MRNKNLSSAPLGWNSWDCFGAAVTEKQLFENAEYMAKNLKQFGWEYIVCDIRWYEPNAKGNDYNNFADLTMDEYGRLLPSENRFPSAKNGAGFKKIADYIHSLGLKFGIHIMRGIPRRAVFQNCKIKGSDKTAREIAHPFSVCSWNTDMYGLKNCEGARAYYDSIFELYASWDIDFVKCDDIAITEFSKEWNPYSAYYEIEMISKAIENCKKEIVLSLSPGPALVEKADHLKKYANMWRMTGDFWDEWGKLKDMFDRCKAWQGIREKGAYPDCDMLPMGRLCKNAAYCGEKNRASRFTFDEQKTMLSLWSIFGSPLFLGGNLPETDEKTLSLLTNKELLSLQQSGFESFEKSRENEIVTWFAVENEIVKHIAIFNISDEEKSVTTKNEYGKMIEIWDNETFENESLSFVLAPHSCKLFKII